MSNIMESRNAWIWNTIGIINGTNEDEVVIVGNHHDAWMIGGAGEQYSHTTIYPKLNVFSGSTLGIDNSD